MLKTPVVMALPPPPVALAQLKVKVPDTFLVAVSNIEKVSVPSEVLRQAFVPLV